MEKFSLILALLLTFSSSCIGEQSNKIWNATNVDKLKSDLLSGYDRLTRPENDKSVTECWVGISLIHIELDETKGVLETHAWMRLNWSDSKLKWDPKNYEDIKQLNVHADEVWQPDVTVYNSAEANIVDHFAKTNKIVYPSGMVLWVPTSKFITYCEMNLKFWPFDEQHCVIKVGSWTHHAYQINLIVDKNPVDTEHFIRKEWEITSTSAERNEKYYPCCPEPYVDITFHLNFRRLSPMFKAIAIVPAIVVVLMTLVAFWLPPQSGEKLLLNGIACIMVCLLLMYLSKLLPIMSSTSPLLVTFYSHTLYLLSVSFILSALVINLARSNKSRAVSGLGRAILDGFLGKTFGGGGHAEPIKEGHVEAPLVENKSNDERHNIYTPTDTKAHLIQNEWTRLAITIDRTAFIIYLIIFILMGFYHFV